ncbi:MAG: DEAD/DEAH box helicase family protein, partial [Planctomycetales bacterium]|nr:DEAD/DEAH box helicase family protein [Planctomycetales bacterium]
MRIPFGSRRTVAGPATSVSPASADAQRVPVEMYSTGWQRALQRVPQVELTTIDTGLNEIGIISVRCPRPVVKTMGYEFAESPFAAAAQNEAARQQVAGKGTPPKPKSQTRMKPPKDTVRLSDRLFYLLQPPVESWLASESLQFPFTPFPYQFQGIGFLYPRYNAILADEMGLGKTMQAISTIRLLLHTGEVRSVLLVCPKPLVTNWMREFALWAPEIPLGVIGGPGHRRQWQWQEVQLPVKIANYELLVRDGDVLDQSGAEFDLVVLDEAQRVKNRSSTTSQVARSLRSQRRWALTGTPVENSAEDLVGIFEFLSPGFLSSTLTPREMGKLVGDYILRRTKDKVLTDMPPKMFRDADIALTPEQRATYETAESDGVIKLTE